MGGATKPTAPSTYPKLADGPVGKHVWNLYRERLNMFTGGGQYEGQFLLSMIDDARTSDEKYVKLEVYHVPDLARPSFKDAVKNKFEPTHKFDSYGPSWSTHWIRVTLKVPKDLEDAEHLEFQWDAHNEGLVWSEDGEPLQGLTGNGDRVEWIFPKSWRDGKEHIFYIEMACNGMFGNAPGGDSIQPPDPNRYFQLTMCDIVAVNLEARALFVDFWILGDAAREFPTDSWESHLALQTANKIMDTFVKGDKESITKCRDIAKTYLGKHIDSSKIYEGDENSLVFATGHCHIDTCWLWPFAETKRKVARSWANQCNLIDRYPEHRFTCSQAQQYKWLKQYYPTLFDRVKEKVKQGTFHPIGGSWVEHDTNMPSGESLVRQFILGQRFFESHFGERCNTFWLPDTFGYSSQLPQLCRLAGMSRFLTQKLSWNNINNFPHTTFNWVALDGSQVICHMPPSETYTADAHFGDVKRSVSQHKSMDQDSTSLLVFGKGDGGGGPTWTMLEKLRRCRGISDNVGLLPRVKLGDSVDDFFSALEKKAADGTKFVTWYGELYFELHRGTYTTQSNNKKNNRKAERFLHDIEFAATLASLKTVETDKKPYKYPKEDIDDLWEIICLCQFHDCLPGSSIEMCYRDSDELYAQLFERGQKLIRDALKELGLVDHDEGDGPLVAVNTLPWARSEIVKLPNKQFGLVKGNSGEGTAAVYKAPPAGATIKKSGDAYILDNNKLRVKVEDGVITSLYDYSAAREVIPKGAKANQLVIFEDKPLYWQAWDVEVYHLDTRETLTPSKTVIVEESPEKVSLLTETQISSKSWIKTTISLSAAVDGQPSFVEFDSEVEWREDMRFLKVEFPVDVVNTEASYETQFGVVRRPTHYNTSWDMAKFEVCCHKFADLSEHGYGVSILNDSKYGFATVGNVMRLSLIRAPKAPDAHADMGRHHIRYAILPHKGPLSGDVVRTALNFNSPLHIKRAASSAGPDALLSSIKLDAEDSLILDTIKRGEDDEDVSRGEFTKRKGQSVILRIYDSLGGKSRGTIKTSLPVKKAYKTNILEDDLEEIPVEKGQISIELRPFEVGTYRLQL